MENENITYSIDFDSDQPVIITAKIKLQDGEVIHHKRNISFKEAKAIAEAYNKRSA